MLFFRMISAVNSSMEKPNSSPQGEISGHVGGQILSLPAFFIFFSKPTNKQTDRQTNKQTNLGGKKRR